jgi:hypothetical protein
MTVKQWFALKPGSIILSYNTKRPRVVLYLRNGGITLKKDRGFGITVYCRGDRNNFIATGFKIKNYGRV